MNLQQYLATLLAEECAEVAQRATKLARFGAEEVQQGQPLTNQERLLDELNDLSVVKKLLMRSCKTITGESVCKANWQAKTQAKTQKILRYTALSVDQGQVSQTVYNELKALIPTKQ